MAKEIIKLSICEPIMLAHKNHICYIGGKNQYYYVGNGIVCNYDFTLFDSIKYWTYAVPCRLINTSATMNGVTFESFKENHKWEDFELSNIQDAENYDNCKLRENNDIFFNRLMERIAEWEKASKC